MAQCYLFAQPDDIIRLGLVTVHGLPRMGWTQLGKVQNLREVAVTKCRRVKCVGYILCLDNLYIILLVCLIPAVVGVAHISHYSHLLKRLILK